jgi:hypothetical protein
LRRPPRGAPWKIFINPIGTIGRFQRGFLMCDKCAKLDKKIEHYETMLVSIGDRVTVERLMALVADLQAQKAALHPEQKQ